MSCRIITEGEEDRLILESLLGTILRKQEFHVMTAGGRSSAVSLARSVLATLPHNVVLVVDADTLDPPEIAARDRRVQEALGEVADPARFLVRVIVPEVEALLFPTPEIASVMLGKNITADEHREILTHPHQALRELVGGPSIYSIQHLLSKPEAAVLGATPQIQSIAAFIRSGQKSERTLAAG